MTVRIEFPFTQSQAVAVVATAAAFGVEPWEMALHVLDVKALLSGERNYLRDWTKR